MTHSPRHEKNSQPPSQVEGGADLAELMDQVRAGSTVALQALMDRLWAELVRFAAWEFGNADAARDVVQDAFIDLWSNRRSWVRSGSPRAYLYKVVRHKIVDQRRRERVRKAWVAGELRRPQPRPPDPEQMLMATRAEEAFSQAVASLPPRRREAFNLVVMRGLSHQETAEILSISSQTVANQVSKALRDVRQAMDMGAGETQ